MVALTPFTRAEDNPVDILLVDSRQLVRAGIERVLSDSGHLTVSDAAANCDEAVRLARRQRPQISMVNLPGFSAAADRSGADAPCHPPWTGTGSRHHLALV